jgi:predicted helicase
MKINPQHNKHFDAYYNRLKELRAHYASNEQELQPAFQELLAAYGREQGWTLIPQLSYARGIIPDGTFRDTNTFRRGYWEAKDTKDNLEAEIHKKLFERKYPSNNIIFEDTRRAVLYQGGKRVDTIFDLTEPRSLADLLELFFAYTEGPIETYTLAVAEFKDRIPDLAQGLLELINRERANNRRFQRAFADFHALCKQALNPNISVQAIDEMLVQHLLTSRLFSTVFDNPDFLSRNVIAVEIEKVIVALTSQSFSRTEFLRGLDRFYLAIEEAARSRRDWSEKQAFMNTVYERFFQGFAVKQADTYGIVYTPQEIVNFMVASVDEVLRREFGKDLSAEGVQILDPATGTGSFIVNILRRVSGSALERKYKGELFANEIMLLPYYIASLNIEHVFYEQTGRYLPFEGICFADTLDMVTENQPAQLPGFSEANTARVERESQAEITVIIGNPPYNVGQVNENDNNKNQHYKQVDGRVRDTYAAASKATNKNALSDVYVKFFRWAVDRLGNRDGIVCFVSNNGFLNGIAFDGFRKHAAQDFTQVYHLDLGGNLRKRGGGNVFGIKVGVGITLLIRRRNNIPAPSASANILYHALDDNQSGSAKLALLTSSKSISGLEWQELQPDNNYTWLTEGLQPEFGDFLAVGTKQTKTDHALDAETIFKNYSSGVKTNRDDWVYDYNRDRLIEKVKRFIKTYTRELDSWRRREDKTISVDNFVSYDDTDIKWSESLKQDLLRGIETRFDEAKIHSSLYRPFCKQWLFFDRVLNERVYQLPHFFPTPASEAENAAICVAGVGDRKGFGCLITNLIPSLDLAFEKAQCFPYYTYDEDGSNRKENITDWALAQFQAQYGAEVSKRDIFHYVYALLHHPAYRQRYAENLKRELPRIPLVPDRASFEQFAQAGAALAHLHLHYDQAEAYPLAAKETPGERFTYYIKKMRLSPDKRAILVNDALTLEGIPPETFQYRLGNRSALEWVIDQYQVSTDPRSGIVTDPNRRADADYDDSIVQLLRRVITVSLQTVALVDGLPALPAFGQPGA